MVWRADTPLAEDTRAPAHNTKRGARLFVLETDPSAPLVRLACPVRAARRIRRVWRKRWAIFNLDRRSDCLPVRITRPHRICAKISTLRFYWLLS